VCRIGGVSGGMLHDFLISVEKTLQDFGYRLSAISYRAGPIRRPHGMGCGLEAEYRSRLIADSR
jgi:hypothetical protein